MQISEVIRIASLLSLTAARIVTTIAEKWDYTWEEEMPVEDLACWSEDKDNVIKYMGWESLKNLPVAIAGYEGGRRQAMLVLDYALSGFATDYETFESLTDGQAWRTGKANVTAFHSSDLRDSGIGSEPAGVDRKFIGDYQPFEEPSS
ncbi:hypothetical protein FOCG_13586 [Fusarium oxysporum f. sp. radicis-lycopersici 26381]|nr:hypothetical protein FOCG_13586 [Fusarium oxysporum f. sp. radicis-lycopersici 26381]